VPDAGAGAPAYGNVTIVPDRTYTYTPTQAGQLRAGLAGADTDGFTVTVSDGQHSVPVTVDNIPVEPAALTVSPNSIKVGSFPLGVAVSPTAASPTSPTPPPAGSR
jgi:VCBS repeat-containing protein